VDGPARFQIIKQAPAEMISAVCKEMEPEIECDWCFNQATFLALVHGLINQRLTVVTCEWCLGLLAAHMSNILQANLRRCPEDQILVCACCRKPLHSLDDLMSVEDL